MASPRNSRQGKREDPITVGEIARIAQKNLDPNVWNYYECGAEEEQALDRNTHDFDRYAARTAFSL